jgi:hypothetical protein
MSPAAAAQNKLSLHSNKNGNLQTFNNGGIMQFHCSLRSKEHRRYFPRSNKSNDVTLKIEALQNAIMLLLNDGDAAPHLFITVICYVHSCDDHTVQKSLLLYLESIGKTDSIDDDDFLDVTVSKSDPVDGLCIVEIGSDSGGGELKGCRAEKLVQNEIREEEEEVKVKDQSGVAEKDEIGGAVVADVDEGDRELEGVKNRVQEDAGETQGGRRALRVASRC